MIDRNGRRTEYLCIGLLAHVDAGKTTLSEAILHRTGAIRSAGRVDHGDAFLDTNDMERDRGITIFSKQASFMTQPAARGAGCYAVGKSAGVGKDGAEPAGKSAGVREGGAEPAGKSAGVEKGAESVFLPADDRVWTLVDTPGHVDFSTEMERVLQVLDYAVLIISAADGVTGQVRVLWRLLEHYGVPAFIFVNKMDQAGADREDVYAQIRSELGTACVNLQADICGKPDGKALGENSGSIGSGNGGARSPGGVSGRNSGAGNSGSASGSIGSGNGGAGNPGGVSGRNSGAGSQGSASGSIGSGNGDEAAGFFSADVQEEIAVCDDELMERFLEGGEITLRDAAVLVADRKLFPVCFGSALREEGVDDLLVMLDMLASEPARGSEFGARVYKITHDAGGARLTWMKVTGGVLLPRQQIPESPDEKGLPEKAGQLRFYKGERYDALQEAPAGIIVAVPGLSGTRAGMGLGVLAGEEGAERLLQPVMQSRLLLPPDQDLYGAYRKLRVLEEEDPMLRLSYDEEKKEITVQVMGQVQREILQRLIGQRFDMRVEFGEPRIVYRETIAEAVEGVGHFEPLRHYAEVHLLMEPGEPGSGLVFESRCSVNDLALNWQRLIMTHLEERRHRGVLIGAEITDMKISILGGRAHAKHTEGGDFRKATYRAVRQGLMMAKSVLLEPDYEFRLEVPQENVGRAMADLQQKNAVFGQPDFAQNTAILKGTVTVAALGNYVEEVAAYTRGAGTLYCSLRGYVPCQNAEEIIAASGYDPETDMRNPSSSVFCSHGAGTIIPWYEVRSYMHVDTGWRFPEEAPAMTEEQSLELAAERAKKAAEEREKQRRLLEAGGLSSDQAGQGSFEGIKNSGNTGASGAPGKGGAKGDVRKQNDAFKKRQSAVFAAEKELMQIFERTYGPIPPRAGAGSEASLFDTQNLSGSSGKKGKKKKNSDPWGLEEIGVSKRKGDSAVRDMESSGDINEGSRTGSGPSGTSVSDGTAEGMEDRPTKGRRADSAYNDNTVKGSRTGSDSSGGASGAGSGAGYFAETKSTDGRVRVKQPQQQDHYMLVDGYNIIFAWDKLRELALVDIKAARDKLMDILSNFAGYRPEKVILVFDAYKVAGGPGKILRWHNIDVVFTKEAETADLYIEKTAHVLAKKYKVTVATSDAVEQIIIFGAGAYRMSAKMLLEEIIFTEREMRERYAIGTDE